MAMQRARQEAEAVRSLRQTSLSLAEEVSRRERAEASLLQWQRLEAVGQLTGGIAHDFNNLLTIILGNLQLADRRADIGGMRRLHDAMRQAAERGAGLTRQLLAFSRQQALNPEAVDLNSVLQNTRAWISRGIAEDVEIGFDLQSDLWAAQVDVGEFEAAILNIAVNARDAMPDGGQLTIRTRNLELTPDDAQHHPNLAPGPYVCVSLEDTGQGMPPDVLARVYEPFFTTKEVGKGTGLGLSRVYGFVQQSGGSIKVESQVGQGTTVSIYLPKSSAPATAIGEDASDKITASGTGTVLVVEDNEDLRRVTVSLLHDLGYSTMVARNGIEALAVLRAGEPVDLLFSDIVMPRGMTGVQLAREALALQPDLKVLLTTGFAGSLAEHDFPVLQKPFSELELSRAIGRAMLSEQTV
jgi:signal transduction histidine kinase/CheY-like chemotaxis protein